ncbi:MAG TPA: hypothetical protein PLR41_06040, partial [Alphaproteobacteria bacterium]|nr:hypothetical protein [Alphaproteobacteria bacterium]
MFEALDMGRIRESPFLWTSFRSTGHWQCHGRFVDGAIAGRRLSICGNAVFQGRLVGSGASTDRDRHRTIVQYCGISSNSSW